MRNNELKLNKAGSRRKQGGFTMLEFAFVALLIGIASAFFISGQSGREDISRAKSWAGNIIQSSSNLENRNARFPLASRYSGITLANVSATLTEELRNSISGTSVLIDWDATITLSPTNSVGGSGNSNFMWTVLNVPKSVCEEMLVETANKARVALSGSTGTTQVRNTSSSDVLTPTEMGTVCAADSATNSFRVVF